MAKKEYQALTSSEAKDKCDLCMFRLCFAWAGLPQEKRQQVIDFMEFLQKKSEKGKIADGHLIKSCASVVAVSPFLNGANITRK